MGVWARVGWRGAPPSLALSEELTNVTSGACGWELLCWHPGPWVQGRRGPYPCALREMGAAQGLQTLRTPVGLLRN